MRCANESPSITKSGRGPDFAACGFAPGRARRTCSAGADRSQRIGLVAQHDPHRRVIAGPFFAADGTVDAGIDEALGGLRAQQQMIDAQPGIARPAIAHVIPESVDRCIGMAHADGIDPALLENGVETARGFAAGAARYPRRTASRRCRGRSARRCSRRRVRPGFFPRKASAHDARGVPSRQACMRISGRAADCHWERKAR